MDENGRWSPAFEGQRPPFERGHTLSVKHGAYAVVKLAPRAAEIADEFRARVPSYSASDEAAVQNLAIVTAQIERASLALAEVDEVTGDRPLASFVGEPGERFERLRADLRSWLGIAARLHDALGLTPRSRWELNLTAASAVDAAQRIDIDTLPVPDRVRLLELLDKATAVDEVPS